MCTFLSFLQEKIRQNLQFSLLKIEIKKNFKQAPLCRLCHYHDPGGGQNKYKHLMPALCKNTA